MAGREGTELQYLERYYEKNGSQLVVLYGQKNLGMKDMVFGFCKDKPYSFYQARPCAEREQLFLWGNELREKNAQISAHPQYAEIFDALIAKRTQKKIIVIDEFQDIVKHSPDFMPQLVAFLKNEWKNQQVMVLLCSTSIGWIENSMVRRIGTAVYDISGLIKMKEQGFSEVREFFRENTKQECLELYGVLGGFPGLWQHFETGISVKENICKHILKQDSFLLDEALRLVSGELRETGVYHAILTALASGKQKLNDLHLHTGFSRAKISVYLKNLMELEIVEKVFSYDTAGRENTQKGIYRIKNRFIGFYFRYLYPHMSSLYQMLPEQFFEKYIAPDMEELGAASFRDAVRELLEQKNAAGELPFVYTKMGEWVGKIGTIDMVAEDEEGHTLIVFCNGRRKPMSQEDYEWLLFCVEKARLSPDCIYLFSAFGFDAGLLSVAGQNEQLQLMDMEVI